MYVVLCFPVQLVRCMRACVRALLQCVLCFRGDLYVRARRACVRPGERAGLRALVHNRHRRHRRHRLTALTAAPVVSS